jgi:hypothetical protein
MFNHQSFEIEIGAVVQLVRMPDCRSGGRGFESLRHRSWNHTLVAPFVVLKRNYGVHGALVQR